MYEQESKETAHGRSVVQIWAVCTFYEVLFIGVQQRRDTAAPFVWVLEFLDRTGDWRLAVFAFYSFE